MNTIINQDSHLLPLHSHWHFPIELSPHAKEKVTAPMVFFLGGGKQIILSSCLEWLATMKGFIFLIMNRCVRHYGKINTEDQKRVPKPLLTSVFALPD